MNIGIGAIFRDEAEYIPEWIAWHKIAGFQEFIIADNSSSDGTTEILEALEEAGLISLIHQPILEKNAQIVAYQRISQQAIQKIDALLFLDADEFIIHDSMIDGAEIQQLKELLKDPKTGMIGINWRAFGSSGLEKFSEDPVMERFTNCCRDSDHGNNCHIKSVTKIALAKLIGPHKSDLQPSFKKVDATGKELSEFILISNGAAIPAKDSGITKRVTQSPLRINHYVIKSREEFFKKKSKRGDAMDGPTRERGEQYFKNHNFSDEIFRIPHEKIKKLKKEIELIRKEIKEKSNLDTKFIGAIDSVTKNGISGWLASKTQPPKKPKIKIFINGVYHDFINIGFYRPDLKEKGISEDGMNGFRWTPPSPLKPGDIIEVRVNANRFKFPCRERTEIQQTY